ncbi:MAG: HEAT repeat domain-containing protein [Planctomycetota bacterium]|jgi:HEAT repeat protein
MKNMNINCQNRGLSLINVLIITVIVITAAVFLLSGNPLEKAQNTFSKDSTAETSDKVTALEELIGNSEKYTEETDKIADIVKTALTDEDTKVLEKAVKAAETFKLKSCAADLAGVASDKKYDDELRFKSVEVLSSLGLKKVDSDTAENMADVILNKDNSFDLRKTVISESHNFWKADILKALVKVSTDKKDSVNIRLAAIEKAGEKLVIGSPYMGKFFALYSDENTNISEAAQKALKQARSRDNIFQFYGYGTVVSNAMKGVSNIQAMNAQRQQQLLDMMNDDGKKKKKKTPLEGIAEKLKSEDPAVRLAAVYDLGELNDAKAIPYLKTLTEREKKGRIHLMLAKTMGKLNKKEAIPVLISLAEKAHVKAKPACFTALEKITGKNFGHDLKKWKQYIK